MTNRDFYVFCRDKRKTEEDPHKKVVLQETYNFMWECGVTKDGIKDFVNRMIADPKNASKVEAFNWLLGIFGV